MSTDSRWIAWMQASAPCWSRHAVGIDAQGVGDIAQAGRRDLRVEGFDVGQQHSVAHAVRQVVEAAELMRHGMDVAKRGVVEGHAGHEAGVGHRFARRQVVALGHRGAEVVRR